MAQGLKMPSSIVILYPLLDPVIECNIETPINLGKMCEFF